MVSLRVRQRRRRITASANAGSSPSPSLSSRTGSKWMMSAWTVAALIGCSSVQETHAISLRQPGSSSPSSSIQGVGQTSVPMYYRKADHDFDTAKLMDEVDIFSIMDGESDSAKQDRRKPQISNSISTKLNAANIASKKAKIALVPDCDQTHSRAERNQQILKISTPVAVAFGMLLALGSGFINGACLSGILSQTKCSTAAVTGTWTASALGLARQNKGQFLLSSKYLLSFMGGSAIGGFLNPNPVPFQIDNPKGVAAAFGMSSALLVLATFVASIPRFASHHFLSLCLAANGISNSLTSGLTANLCRTSHMSGIASDIGTFLGQWVRGNRDNMQKLKVFPLLSLSFWVGGFAAFPVTKYLASRSFLLVAGMQMALASSLMAKTCWRPNYGSD